MPFEARLWGVTPVERNPRRGYAGRYGYVCFFGYVSDYTHKRSQLMGLERTFGIACHAQPFSLLKSLPQYVNVCVQLHGAMTRVLAQQNRTYTVHVLFFAVLKQLKEAAVFPEEHGCVILSQCIEHVSACCFNCVYL